MVGPGGGAQGQWDTGDTGTEIVGYVGRGQWDAETVGHGGEGQWDVGHRDGGTWGYGPWDTRQREVGAVCEHGDSGTRDTSTQGQCDERVGTVGHAYGRTWGWGTAGRGGTVRRGAGRGWGTVGLAGTAGRPAGHGPGPRLRAGLWPRSPWRPPRGSSSRAVMHSQFRTRAGAASHRPSTRYGTCLWN